VVGAFAVAFHAIPRFTGDLDLWVRRTPENAARIERALRRFSFVSLGLSAADFLEADRVVQLGHRPNRIDLLTSLTGVEFDEAWPGRVPADLDGIPVAFIGRDALIRNKRATARAQDRADLEALGAA
jgi:hypothetical protein